MLSKMHFLHFVAIVSKKKSCITSILVTHSWDGSIQYCIGVWADSTFSIHSIAKYVYLLNALLLCMKYSTSKIKYYIQMLLNDSWFFRLNSNFKVVDRLKFTTSVTVRFFIYKVLKQHWTHLCLCVCMCVWEREQMCTAVCYLAVCVVKFAQKLDSTRTSKLSLHQGAEL
jgi:hypothetical protein